jgi:hypothetical protein
MTTLLDQSDAPSHLFEIPELDFSEDLFVEPLAGGWFRLGAWTITPRRDERGVEDVISRQSLLVARASFAKMFDRLESVGNVLHDLGKPGGSVLHNGDRKEYSYTPFHRFEISSTSITAEPLVFIQHPATGPRLLINPDLWLFFELEEKTRDSGIWWDPRKGVEPLRQRTVEQDNLQIIEIRTDYLLKYLQARQIALLVGHYRHLHLFDSPPEVVARFKQEDLVLGSPERGAKALFQNWGLTKVLGSSFLQRRLHLWFQIEPPEIDAEDPWADEPPFDPRKFTLPTRVGPVAPGLWKRLHFRGGEEATFDGGVCDFMERVYFRQEVLTKYEGASGFDVTDDGSVSCAHYWGLVRSTTRLGNELLSTSIGDFAEGVPFDEWPHWKQYAVEPPSREMIAALEEEQAVPAAVNSLIEGLGELNSAFAQMAASLGVTLEKSLWGGSLESLAGRQLKWVYPVTADDDEFLKRATLASTLVIDELEPPLMRQTLAAVSQNLDKTFDNPPQTLGSRNLLQRHALVAVLMKDFQPNVEEISKLVKVAEGSDVEVVAADVHIELANVYKRVRDDFAPLAFLYDLRTHGGLAHPPNKAKAGNAAQKLELPTDNWHRSDYLQLLKLVTKSIRAVAAHFDAAAKQLIVRV